MPLLFRKMDRSYFGRIRYPMENLHFIRRVVIYPFLHVEQTRAKPTSSPFSSLKNAYISTIQAYEPPSSSNL